MGANVPLAEAARSLGKSEATVRRWVREGAPCARPGRAGRNGGALVVVEDLQRWRATTRAAEPDSAHFLAQLKHLVADYHRAGDHRLVGLQDEPARLLYAALLEYVGGRLNRAAE